ncbi:site-specific integrase [Vibrio rumoiensis]|uniref:site-specific integrase n=1 Tax=Vibrio rumoiensis TaxID=76258 RepID=UPI003747FDDD
MYLIKQANSVYYTRICCPKALVRLGYPFDIKVSLLTKDRHTASLRNLHISALIKQLLHEQLPRINASPLSFRQFKRGLDSRVDNVRQNVFQRADYFVPSIKIQTIDVPSSANEGQSFVATSSPSIPTPTLSETKTVSEAFDEFIVTKQNLNIRALTVHQLKQRGGHFVQSLENKELHAIRSRDLLKYVDRLNQEGRSAKTSKEYFAACRQFMTWCTRMNYLDKNPADNLTISFKNRSHASEERQRWSSDELQRLLGNREQLKSTNPSLYWITLLLLCHGMRPGEACQLRLSDIKTDQSTGIAFMQITDTGEHMHLKNSHAIRQIPLHHYLLRHGFLDYVAARRRAKANQLFDCRPTGPDADWSKRYRTQFGQWLTALGFSPKKRPTAYSLRHTFIDELKLKQIAEFEVAELVGHTNSNMTYGRYGKRLGLERLKSIVDTFPILWEVS